MATIKRFEDLKVWQSARQLVNLIYDLSDERPFARDFGLRDQIRRAAVSVMSNTAEGFDSRTHRLFIDYLGRAKASAGEVRSQLYIARDRAYITQPQFDAAYDLVDKTARQLRSLIDYLHTNDNRVREEAPLYLPDA